MRSWNEKDPAATRTGNDEEKTMKKHWIAAAAAACLPAWAAAQSAGQDALYIRSLAATCANCHGTDGRPVEGGGLPALAGMPREYMLTQLRAFKAGTRQATIMHQLSKGYSDAQLVQLSTYFAAQKR